MDMASIDKLHHERWEILQQHDQENHRLASCQSLGDLVGAERSMARMILLGTRADEVKAQIVALGTENVEGSRGGSPLH